MRSASSPPFAGPELEIDQFELVADHLVAEGHFIADAIDGGIQAHTRLNTDHHEIQGVRKAPEELLPAGHRFELEPEIRCIKPAGRQKDKDQYGHMRR